jgi:hypothetical protein
VCRCCACHGLPRRIAEYQVEVHLWCRCSLLSFSMTVLLRFFWALEVPSEDVR